MNTTTVTTPDFTKLAYDDITLASAAPATATTPALSSSVGGVHAALLLEINTLPGMTPLSLLPKSAACHGLDFAELVRQMITPAIARHHAAAAT